MFLSSLKKCFGLSLLIVLLGASSVFAYSGPDQATAEPDRVLVVLPPSDFFHDKTAEAIDENEGDITIDAMDLDSAVYIGYEEEFEGFSMDFSTEVEGFEENVRGGRIKIEYFTTAGGWKDMELMESYDLANANGNVEGSDHFTFTWDVPTNWAKKSISVTKSYYYVRLRVTNTYASSAYASQIGIVDASLASVVVVDEEEEEISEELAEEEVVTEETEETEESTEELVEETEEAVEEEPEEEVEDTRSADEQDADLDCAHVFRDLDGHWGEHAICLVTGDDFVDGFSSFMYGPDVATTRGDFLKLVLMTAGYGGLDAVPGVEYSDVSEEDEAYKWVSIASDRGFVKGYEDGTFRPDAEINRVEALIMILKVAGIESFDVPAEDLPFSDVTPADWFAWVVHAGVEYGLVKGYADGSFKPGNGITRAEMAVVARRVLYALYPEFL